MYLTPVVLLVIAAVAIAVWLHKLIPEEDDDF